MTQAQPQKRNTGGSSRPVILRSTTLRSYQAQHTFRRSWEGTSRSFYLLTVVLRAIANDDEAREVEGVVDAQITEMQDRLTAETARLERICEDSGIDPAPSFTKPQNIDVEISSPRANRYLGLINQMDRVVGLISLLWLSGVRNDSQYSAECYLWQRGMLRLSNRVREIANRALAAANRVRAGVGGDVNGDADEDALSSLTPVPLDHEDDDQGSDHGGEHGEGRAETADSGAEPEAKKRPGRKKKEAVEAGEPIPDEAGAEPVADAA